MSTSVDNGTASDDETAQGPPKSVVTNHDSDKSGQSDLTLASLHPITRASDFRNKINKTVLEE